MRHLVGIVLAVVAAVVIFFAGGWGYLKLPAGSDPFRPTQENPFPQR